MADKFTNTFQNGLSSDYNIVLQPDGTYRYLKNCQLVSQDGNNYVIKDCLGNTLMFTINSPYSGVYTTVGLAPMPIGFISFPNKLIVFSTYRTDSTGGFGEIGIVKYLPYGEGIQPLSVAGEYHAGYVPLYCHDDLKFTQMHRIEGFSFIENELIERVYWTDNFNEPRVFNVSDPIFTNYFTSAGANPIVSGNTYMVLEGAIQHPVGGGNPIYGPGLTDGNVFVASSATYTILTGTSPTPKIVAYYPTKLLAFTPDRDLGNITFKEFGSGSVYCGSKVYFYRLGKNTNGIVTTWSYGSSPIAVGTQNDSVALTSPTVGYHDWTGGGTATALLNSTLSVLLNIENVDTDYDYIEVACAEYDQLISTPRQITIVAKEDVTSSTMVITHDGATNLRILTIGDITLFPASVLRCKTLGTNKNYIFQANTTERLELDIEVSYLTSPINFSPVNYPMNSHYDASSCSLSGMVYSGISPTSGANPAGGTVTPFSRWLVTAGQPIYNGTTYQVGEVITGVTGAGNDSIDFATHAGSEARPCVTKNRYTPFSTTDRVENAIELKRTNDTITDCFWDYKSAAAHHHVAGYWSGETYRFGILFYDLKGNPYYVRWLADYTFPTAIFKGGTLRIDEIGNSGVNVYSLNPTFANISGITIPPDVISQISGFSIVRAERDARIVTQGLVTQNVDTGAAPKIYRPGAWNPISLDLHNVADKIYTYICPDSLVGVPLKKSIGIVGDTMEEACWLDPYNYGGGVVVRGQGAAASEQVYTKYPTCLDDGPIRTGTITYYGSVDESTALTGLPAGASYENGTINTAAAAVNVEGNCVTGGVDYTLNNHFGTGGKKDVFILENDFLHYGPSANNYTSVAANGQKEKIMMNYVKTGVTTPYGGTSPSSLASTLYISTGHYQPITTAVKNHVFDGTNYVFNNVEVAGGDCYTCLIDYGYSLWDTGFGASAKYSWAWTFPCECNSNYNLRRGFKTSNVEMYYTGTALTESIIVDGGASRLESFSYNNGYSTEGQNAVYPALPVNFINSGSFQARVRYAGVKFIGESIDSFRTFAITDFKDLAANYGRINKLAVKDDRVVVFQDLAVNTVPVLERQLLGAGTGDQTTIGTGGVVDRFDVITSDFGTQHQWSVIDTKYGFLFFDMKNKAVIALDFSNGLTEISQVLGLKAFFDEVFVEIEGSSIQDADKLLNSPTFAESSDRPLVGVGITGVYDPKFKMTYLTFKFYGQNSGGFKSKDFTIGYLHTDLKKCFVGFFDWTPAIAHNHNQIVISANNPKNTTQYLTTTLTNKVFAIGDTIWGDGFFQDEYICIAPVTLDNVAKYPKGASGATYWLKVNSVNELWVHNQPIFLAQTTAPNYLYNMFFGKVVDNEIQIVINPPLDIDESMYVASAVQEGPYNVNFTSIYISADNQSASDVSIRSTSVFYRFIRDKIIGSMPLSTSGRIANKYLLFRGVKHNWTDSPYTLATSVKILRSLSSWFTKLK